MAYYGFQVSWFGALAGLFALGIVFRLLTNRGLIEQGLSVWIFLCFIIPIPLDWQAETGFLARGARDRR